VVGDTNGVRDVFLSDRTTARVTRISVSSAGAESDGFSFETVISGDGRYITYTSVASSLVVGDTNAVTDVFLFANPAAAAAPGRPALAATGSDPIAAGFSAVLPLGAGVFTVAY